MNAFYRTEQNELNEGLDIYCYKQTRLLECIEGLGKRTPLARVGLPLQLGMYEQLPIWSGFFETLGFEVVLSEKSSLSQYPKDSHTSAPYVACYPARLIHSHIKNLLDKGVDFIFMPCESYSVDSHCSVNDCNCSVVAYYPELLRAGDERLSAEKFVAPYLDLNMRSVTVKNLKNALCKFSLKPSEIDDALNAGFAKNEKFCTDVKSKADEILAIAETLKWRVIVLAGRPYCLDSEINHGINRLLTSMNLAVISDDVIYQKNQSSSETVVNGSAHYARLCRAAEFVSKRKNINLVHLISDKCVYDTTVADGVRAILENNGKPYTQIELDETGNLGDAEIKLKFMLAADGKI